jgi:DNA-binding HxlR family transcriptional regulator
MSSTHRAPRRDSTCAVTRTLAVLNDSWGFLILREVFNGTHRFTEMRDHLEIASDVLTARLSTLVGNGVLSKEPYHEPGQRTRFAYQLTPAGEELKLVLAGLQQWGDEHLPHPGGQTVARVDRTSGLPLHVAFVDDNAGIVALQDATFVHTENYPRS